MLHDFPQFHDDGVALSSIEMKFDLSNSQLQAWKKFEATFREVREALEANLAMQARERAPTFEEYLEFQSRCLAVQLGATRRLAAAARDFYEALVPRQRQSADRHLVALCRRLEEMSRSSL